MTDALDGLVEKAARAMASLEPGEDWPTNAALGGNGTGTRDDEYRDALNEQAREVLEAIGLPALLERVEAAERVNPILADAMHYYAERRPMNNPKGWERVLRVVARGVENAVWPTSTEEQRRQAIDVINSLVVAERDRDALAAKVADAGERIAQAIEKANRKVIDARVADINAKPHIVDRAMTYAAQVARAALTEGTEGA